MRFEGASGGLPAETKWRKSTFSAENGCVEVGPSVAHVGVRDTKLGAASPVLVFPGPAWSEFTGSLR
ncbi:DUF397 domain-containing protein [Actinokineospora sp. NPDC004072]